MGRSDYEMLCSIANVGIDRFVENRQTGEVGRIVSCKGDRLQVEVYGRKAEWSLAECEEKRRTAPAARR